MAGKKRLCMVLPAHWSSVMGGAQYQASLLLEAVLRGGGFEIVYLSRQSHGRANGKGYQALEIADEGGIRRFGYFADARKLLALLDQLEPHVIYQRVGCGYTGIAAYYAKRRNCRLVWHAAHEWEVSPFRWEIARNLPFRLVEARFREYGIANAHFIITQTKAQNSLLQRWYDREATAIVPNFHPRPKEEIDKTGPRRVVWAANLKPWKRPNVFLRLARDIAKDMDVEFIMIGRGGFAGVSMDELQSSMRRIEKLTYLGGRGLEEVNEVLAKAHVFVNTSEAEGFPNTFIQSWMRQVPVVSLDVNPDHVLNEKGTGLFAQGDYGNLADSVTTLLSDSQKRARLGVSAQSYAFETHSLANADRLVEILREAAS